ncbi:Uncharacterised protein [uncultured archaeon]|nr:Uncharacterised protein [uncultured archaeon]
MAWAPKDKIHEAEVAIINRNLPAAEKVMDELFEIAKNSGYALAREESLFGAGKIAIALKKFDKAENAFLQLTEIGSIRASKLREKIDLAQKNGMVGDTRYGRRIPAASKKSVF